ncbi:membrane progestin receptor gamma isoform X1 [Manis pentadactyla]|uniref:membrane progestin receptor gamma isoform X1 n=1 Tax=Manis pentadactyla TaxID=143292 RepID=UPI00255C4B1C|nr:membrane progestin receptor gamma isoform X1 [Manis pentadactyla]
MLSLKLPRLFSIDQMPEVFHEQGIIFGYRHPQSSATACVLSLFQMTNETLNIWTHLLPFWFFVWKFVTVLCVTDIQNDSYSWPLLVYMGTSCVYPLVSSCAHTFSSMSSNARHICYFLDYGAVNLFSLGSALAYCAYTFPEALVCTSFHDCYVTLAVLNTVLSTAVSCYSRLGGWPCYWASHFPSLDLQLLICKMGPTHLPCAMDSRLQTRLCSWRGWFVCPWGKHFIRPGEILSQVAGNPCFGGWPSPARASCLPVFLEIKKPGLSKVLRVLAFAYPYTWDSIPIFCRLFLFPGESAQNEATLYHQKHMAMTLLASFFYSAHVPERLAPGCFDYIGHSHQLFHVCVILATHMQMEAILLDKTLRKEWLLANSRVLSFPQIAGATLLCLIFSLSNIIYFSASLYRIPEPELQKKET